MNPQITTLDPVSPATHAKTILSQEGFNCSIIMLAPGDETPCHDADNAGEHILFVIDGEATVRFADVNTILSKDKALLIPKGREHVIVAHPGAEAKLLRVDVPPRQVVVPQVLSFDQKRG